MGIVFCSKRIKFLGKKILNFLWKVSMLSRDQKWDFKVKFSSQTVSINIFLSVLIKAEDTSQCTFIRFHCFDVLKMHFFRVKRHRKTGGVKNESVWHRTGGRDRRLGKRLVAFTAWFCDNKLPVNWLEQCIIRQENNAEIFTSLPFFSIFCPVQSMLKSPWGHHCHSLCIFALIIFATAPPPSHSRLSDPHPNLDSILCFVLHWGSREGGRKEYRTKQRKIEKEWIEVRKNKQKKVRQQERKANQEHNQGWKWRKERRK